MSFRGHSRLIAIVLITLLTNRGIAQTTVFQDNFTSALAGAWTVANQDTSYYSFSGGALVLRASAADIANNASNNVPNIFTISNPSSGDFTATLAIASSSLVNNNYAQISLMAFDDYDNDVRANYGYVNGVRSLEFGREVGGSWTQAATSQDFGTGTFYLRLSKVGTSYMQSYSTDGTNFFTANSAVTFGDGTPLYVGFLALADPSASSTFNVDSFTVTGTAFPNPAPPPRWPARWR